MVGKEFAPNKVNISFFVAFLQRANIAFRQSIGFGVVFY
jgi:hypothetical protein